MAELIVPDPRVQHSFLTAMKEFQAGTSATTSARRPVLSGRFWGTDVRSGR